MWANKPGDAPNQKLSPPSPCKKQSVRPIIWVVALLSLLLSGCVTLNDPEAGQDNYTKVIGSVSEGQTVGQSFVSRRARLNGITLWFSSDTVPGDIVFVQLFRADDLDSPVFSTSFTTSDFSQTAARFFNIIPSLNDPAGQAYYIKLSTQRPLSLQIYGRDEDVYPDGQAYINDQPIPSDIAFRLTYDYNLQSALDDAADWLRYGWTFLLLAAVFFLPGWLLLNLTGLQRRLDGGEQVAMAIGLSTAVVPIAMLWSTTLGLRWNTTGVRIAAGILALGVFALWVSWIRSARQRKAAAEDYAPSLIHGQSSKERIGLAGIGLTVVFIAALGLRLAMIRDLALPAWIDPVHHTLIARVIVEQGGMPQTYQPYLDVDPNFYHAGYHANIAAFHWVSGLDLSTVMLIVGQVHNALMCIALYALTTSLAQNRLAGIFAALVTGFLTPMPAYYASWGRYTQLAGLLILPAIIMLARLWMLDKQPAARPGAGEPPHAKIIHKAALILLSGIALGGLFLVHYRVIIFALCLLAPYLFAQACSKDGPFSQKIRLATAYLVLSGLAAILLSLPWLIPAVARTFLSHINSAISPNAELFGDFAWRYLTAALGRQALAAAALGLAWSVLKRRSFGIVLTVWVVILFVIANLDTLQLPGSGYINNSSVAIMLFVPIAILAGYMISEVVNGWIELSARPLWRWSAALAALTLSLAAAFAGARQLLPILNPETFLARQADVQAIAWMNANLPKDETVLTNPFLWAYGMYAGQDGGYWIMSLTGMQTIPPPQVYGLGDPADVQEVNTICEETIQRSGDAQSLWQYLDEHDIRYVYIGRRGGVLSPHALLDSGLFVPRYSQAGVWVFELAP